MMKLIMKLQSKSNIRVLLVMLIFLIYLGCEKEISTTAPDEEIPQGFLYVESQPLGSTIYLNDKNTGRITPGLVPYLESGNYKLSLKKKYLRDTTISVTLTDFDTSKVFIDYLQNPMMLGKITFNSSPANASVYLNDSLLANKTPFTIAGLTPGKYNVRFKIYNHRDSEIPLIVESNKNSTAYSVLRDTAQWVDYQIANSEIQSNILTCVTVDNNNVKWIGTSNIGIISFNENQFINFNTSNSLILSSYVNCLAVNNDNSVWIGTNNGLSILINGTWTNFTHNNSDLPNDNVNSIIFDVNGNAWIGTNNGFSKFDGSTWQNYNYASSSFEYLWVTDLALDQSGNLWIGSNNFGILKFDGNYFTEFQESAYNFLTNRITSLDVDNLDRLWVGQQLTSQSRGGLSIYNGAAFTNLYLGTTNNKINNIFISQQFKWISTNEGFSMYDENNSNTFFSTNNSYLSNNNVTGIAHDKNNNLWITTLGGGLNKYKMVTK